MAWNGNAAKERWRNALAQRLIACAITLQSAETNELGTSYPPSSVPGQYPHRRTGNLQSSVMYEPTAVAEVAKRLEIRVGYAAKAPYIVDLILSGRKALHDTLKRVRPQLVALFGSGARER